MSNLRTIVYGGAPMYQADLDDAHAYVVCKSLSLSQLLCNYPVAQFVSTAMQLLRERLFVSAGHFFFCLSFYPLIVDLRQLKPKSPRSPES